MRVSAEQCLGRAVEEAFPGANQLDAVACLREVHSSGRVMEGPEVTYLVEGTPRLFRVRVLPLGYHHVVVAFEDITDQRAAQDALRSSRERFRALVEAAANVIVTLDSELRYTSVNPAYERLFGMPASAVLGLRPDEISPTPSEMGARAWPASPPA